MGMSNWQWGLHFYDNPQRWYISHSGTISGKLRRRCRFLRNRLFHARILSLTGIIIGTVTSDSTGEPIPGVTVSACLIGGVCSDTITRDDGIYLLTGLVAGNYEVVVWPDENYAVECYNNDYSCLSTTPVTVAGGQLTAPIDFGLATFGVVAGTVVRDSDGQPIPDLLVYACPPGGGLCSNSAMTMADGSYTITTLLPGSYLITVSTSWTDYASEFFDNIYDFSAAVAIAVTGGQTISNINFGLAIGGKIKGTVTRDSDGQPIANLTIQACAMGITTCGSATTLTDGSYTITGLAAGNYSVSVSTAGTDYTSEYYDNAPGSESSTPVAVTWGETISNINFGLASGGTITGTVTRDSDGQPISGLWVSACSTESVYCYSSSSQANGSYTITSVPPGSYRIAVSTSGTDYMPEYYDNAYNDFTAAPVTAIGGQTTSNINFGLSIGGKITGAVNTVADGNFLAGVWIVAGDYDTGYYMGIAKSQTDGSYTISNLSPGRYKMEAITDGTVYATQYFNNASTYNTASPVNLSVSETKPDVNFHLEEVPTIMKGDINGDGNVDLVDVVLALGHSVENINNSSIYKKADINGDGKIGVEEAIYDLQGVSGLRVLRSRFPIIDGIISSGEWNDAASVNIQVNTDWVVTVFYKNDSNNLYFAFMNLKNQSTELYPEILLDVNNIKSVSWNASNWWFHASYNDCEANGQYNVWQCTKAKLGWMANNFPLNSPGIVEIQIAREKIGLVPGDEIDIGMAFDVTDTHTKYYYWPSAATIDSPATWGTWHIK